MFLFVTSCCETTLQLPTQLLNKRIENNITTTPSRLNNSREIQKLQKTITPSQGYTKNQQHHDQFTYSNFQMAVFKDYYKTLGLPQTCSQLEIKSTYRAMALKHHPDKNPNDPKATATFQLIVEAYEKLNDTSSRGIFDQEYDREMCQKSERKNDDNTCNEPSKPKKGKGGRGRGKQNSNTYEKVPSWKQQQQEYSYNYNNFEYMFTRDEEEFSDVPRNPKYATSSDLDDKSEFSFEFNSKSSWGDKTAEKVRKRQAKKYEKERLRREECEKANDARFFYHKMRREKMECQVKRAGLKR